MSQKFMRALTLAAIAWMTFIGHTPAMPVHAVAPMQATSKPACDELQVVFIVDQSASMSGSVRAATDPDGLRFAGPKEAINILSALRWQTYLTTTMRVAIVHFGDRAQTALPWTTLDVASEEQSKQLQAAIAQNLSAKPPLGNTNIKGAFEYASSLFDQVRPAVDGCPIRVVAAITDGQPSLPRDGFSAVAHLNELIAYARRYLPAPDHKIFVIGLDANNEFWEQNRDFYEKIAQDPARVKRVTSPEEMASFMAEIFAPKRDVTSGLQPSGGDASFTCIGNNAGVASSSEILIPPYLQQVRISLIKADKALRLQVVDEGGKLIDQSRSDMSVHQNGQDEPIESLTVANPQPGRWHLLTKLPAQGADLCLAYVLSFNSIGQVLSPAAGDSLVQFKQSPLRVRLVDAGGQPLPNYADPKYALHMDAQLLSTGNAQTITLTAAGNSDEYNATILPLTAGPNTLRIQAATQNVDGSEYAVFDRELASFDVAPVKVALSSTLQGAMPQHKPIALDFNLIAAGQPVDLDMPVQISAVVNYAGGSVPVTLTQSANVPGGYGGEFKPADAGAHTLHFRAQVDAPGGPRVIADESIPFDVFPTSLVSAQFVEPADDRFEAADFLNRPTGLPLQVQLVDETGRALSPGEIGVQNPADVFDLTVLDGDKANVSQRVQLVQTGKPGLFRLAPNNLGPGRYEIALTAKGELNQRFVWEQQTWTRTLQGDISLKFIALLAGAALSTILLILLLMRTAASFRHPLAGNIAVYREVPTDAGDVLRKYLIRQALPQRNRAVLRPATSDRRIIRRLVVTCESEEQSKSKQARVKVQQTSGAETSLLLAPGVRTQVGGYFIVKDESQFGSGAGASAAAQDDLPARS